MAMCNFNVIVVLEFISRGLYLLFAILLSSKCQNSFFYQHMRPKSGLKFPRPLVALQVHRVNNADLLHLLLLSEQDLQGLSVLPLFLYKSHAHMVLLLLYRR